VNRLFAAYLLLSGLALAGPYRPAVWPPLLAAHLGLATLALAAVTGGRKWSQGRVSGWGWVRDLYPLLILPALYAELPILNGAVWGGHYFDGIVLDWERSLFGGNPAVDFSLAAPWPWLSEAMHASYVSYYLIIYVPPLIIAWKVGREALRDTVFTLSLVFFAHYLFFVWFPVEGPYYRFPGPPEAVQDWPAYRLAHAILDAGASRGAAFPSSHVGVSIAAAVICWRWMRPIAPLVTLLAVALAFGAVYGGFHYAIDAIAGAAFGLVLALAAPRLRALLEAGRSAGDTTAAASAARRPA
jgi:membrane-associated phospholipid phosphatase